ncbi:DUF6531 domain-containing protein [Nocardioides euryhalodurans]|uniref:Type IV secretion protein Rhs n=1 Tax=Nocardioides euryhalodurans TaxID=2518370 RepID=A0A4P7GKZ5_9ACTN|nr:DUF6531 domain-containing protein [Nocardioides euryhalodurans]QBR92690.1 type IV secretion protein Rhs [Nocardioides euryhalodurans]
MGLGPVTEDVRFDHAAADELIRLCNAAAGVIEGQGGSRASWVVTASREFRGYFSELFARNQETAKADAEEVAARLRDVARYTGDLAEEAAAEQERRQRAREWQREQDDRGLLEKGWDWMTDGNDAPVPDMPEPSSFEPTVIPPKPRETPTPGSGGGSSGGGTSSARPSDLRTFANGSRGANASLAGKPTSCRSAYSTFVAGCGWGELRADDVFAGFAQYLAANEEDVRWATTIAAAFEAAGGEGQVSTLSNSAFTAALQARGIDASRQDITIDPPQAFGAMPTSGYADDPVNAATGNFTETETDLAFTAGSASLVLDRTYNSFDTGVGGFGPGWSSWTEAALGLDDEAARLRLSDGRVVVFPRLGDGWDRGRGTNLWLAREGDHLVATSNDGERWTHTRDGRLLEHTRGPGTTVRLDRDAAGRVLRLTHERGREIDLTWDDDLDRVVRAADSSGRDVTYAYDGAGRLVEVRTGLGTRTYRWNEQGLIDAVTDADGVVEAENAYDAHRRVTTQRSRHGRVSRFVYLPGNVTVVSDADGSRSNTWISDQQGRLVGAVDSDEQRQSFSYDAHGNRVLVTERDGSATVREFDDRGRTVREVTPTGADLTYGYDHADRLTTVVTAAGGIAEYTYTGDERSPSLLVDPEGGRTEMTWSDGLLTHLVDPAGVSVSFTYDAHGDLVATTDALGNVARLDRDAQGRVVAATTPLGHRTTYTYAPSGALASRRDPDGAVWRFEHTTAGRLSTVIDPTGARTDIEHDDAGDAARTIDPLGRAITRRTDDLGNLAAVELPDGAVWRYTHDAMSRLVETIDPSGGSWRTEYDVNGMPTVSVDPTGVRSEQRRDRGARTLTVAQGDATRTIGLDELGRPVSGRGVDGSAKMWVHDRCGRPVEQLDVDGGLTRIVRDAAGRVTRVTTPAGRTTSYEYDACGRLAAVLDPRGGRTTRSHDADGRLVAVTMPTGETGRIEHDACGRVVASRRPGHGVARYRYDAAGRVVESSDTWYGHRTFRYDAAGQLVEVVNGNGGVTRYGYDAGGRAVSVTDPLGHTTVREFDALDRCTRLTDALGRTTRARYDGAGRLVWQQDPVGDVIEVGYDAAGLDESLTVNGRMVARITRDVRTRRATVTDTTRDAACDIELEWNGLGRLVSRSANGQTVSWGYDADGRRTSMTTPDGVTTYYTCDEGGDVIAVDHPLLGRATFARDLAGRVVEATAGAIVQRWEHAEGAVVAHTVGDESGFTRTEVHRDDQGRIVGLTRGEDHTAFGYDQACQLVEARTGGSTTRWRYDLAGRLVAETAGDSTLEHHHDAAGQLVSTSDGTATARYTYDGAGRRIREQSRDGAVRDLAWSGRGWLSTVTDHLPDGETRRTELHVDATGQLAEVAGVAIHWDSAGFAPTPVRVGDLSVLTAGPLTGLGESWAAAGWRGRRDTGTDPWATGGPATAGLLAGGTGVGADGGLSVAGLEWLGARVYDPSSRGFLSVDPVTTTAGAGWAHNPYSYAGNDPLHALDPLGLDPLTDEDLRAYNASHNGFTTMAATVADRVTSKEFLIGAGLTALGAAAMFVPVPGAQIVGGMLISAGVDTMVQQVTTGNVNWGEVAVSGAFGAFGGVAAGMAVKMGARTMMRQAVVSGGISGAAEGFTKGNVNYFTGAGPHSPTDYLKTVGGATVQSGVQGAVTGPLQLKVDNLALGRMIEGRSQPPLDYPSANPQLGPDPVPVIGNSQDVRLLTDLDPGGHVNAMGSGPLQEAIDYQRPVYVGTDGPGEHAGQLQVLRDAGYTQQGDYMVPGGR